MNNTNHIVTTLNAWFEDYLSTILIPAIMAILSNLPEKTQKGKAMKAELTAFVESNEKEIIARVASFLAAMPKKDEPHQRLNYFLPILRWVDADKAFGKLVNNRTKQLAGFICTALSKGNLGLIGFVSATASVRLIIEVPEFERQYISPKTFALTSKYITGSILEKRYNRDNDRNPEAMRYIQRPHLRISSVWQDRPVMEEPEEKTPEKMEAYANYISKLAPCITETAKLEYFCKEEIQDYRGRVYDTQCVDVTSCKQIRSIIETANPEKVNGNVDMTSDKLGKYPSPKHILFKEFGKIVYDADKKTIQEQYKLGISAIRNGLHEKLSDVNEAVIYCKEHQIGVAEKAYEIANISRAVKAAINGEPVAYLIKWDTKQSGITIQSMLTRCRKSMDTLGILSNQNNDLYMGFSDILGSNMPRAEIKKCVIPRFYGSTKCIMDRVGKAKAEKFFDAYAKVLPKPDALRQIMLDCWNDKATSYYWRMPDGLEVTQIVEEIPVFGSFNGFGDYVEGNATGDRVEFKTGKGTKINSYVYYSKLGTRIKGFDPGTKSLGANLIHSLDAYILRELITRCAEAKHYRNKYLTLKKGTEVISGNKAKVEDLMQMWKETGICSVRVMEFLSDGDTLPEDYHQALENSICHCPKAWFDIVAVHDEFMCHPNYALQMQQAFNYILLEIYEGNYLKYISKQFNWDKYKLSLELDNIDKDISNCISNSTYTLQ